MDSLEAMQQISKSEIKSAEISDIEKAFSDNLRAHASELSRHATSETLANVSERVLGQIGELESMRVILFMSRNKTALLV